MNRLSVGTIFPEPPAVRIEWAEPCLPRHLSRLLLIELTVYRDLQEVDHDKPNEIVEPDETDEAPGNRGDEPAESRHARGEDLRAHYGGKEFPLGERRLEKEAARAGREQEQMAGDDQLHEHRRLQRLQFKMFMVMQVAHESDALHNPDESQHRTHHQDATHVPFCRTRADLRVVERDEHHWHIVQ